MLLVPGRQFLLNRLLSPAVQIALAGAIFLASLQSLTFIYFGYTSRKRVIAHITAILALGILSLLYCVARLYVEMLALGGIAIGHFIALLWKDDDNRSQRFFPDGLTASLNMLAGASLLIQPAWGDYALPRPSTTGQFLLGGLFLFTGVVGLATIIRPTILHARLERLLCSLPWIAWAAVFSIPLDVHHFIPGISIAFSLLAFDAIPWSRIALPTNELLGHRLHRMVSIAQTGLLASLTLLLFFYDGITPYVKPSQNSLRDFTFLFFIIVFVFIVYGTATINMAISGLMSDGLSSDATEATDEDASHPLIVRWINNMIAPYSATRRELVREMQHLEERNSVLSRQLEQERRRRSQLELLEDLSRQLDNQVDQPVAAQLTVNALQRAFNCPLVAIFQYDAEHSTFTPLATAGPASSILPGSLNVTIQQGIVGRAARLRKTQLINNTAKDPDYLPIVNTVLSEMVVPLIYNGDLKGVLVVDSANENAYNNQDIAVVEAAAGNVLRSWDRNRNQQRLTELIQAGVSLSTLIDPHEAIKEMAAITKRTLDARFVYAILLDQDGRFSRTAHAGYAPALLKSLSLKKANNSLVQGAINAIKPFRIRDVRKYVRSAQLDIDQKDLRCVLAIPIRLHRLSIGALLAFGKHNDMFFTEDDESLSNLISTQAAASVESTWLYQELRSTLSITTLLYQLSFNVIQAESLVQACTVIADTAHKIASASVTGIVLFGPDQKVEAEIEIDSNGPHPGTKHPISLLKQALHSGQSIIVSSEQGHGIVAYPLQTPLRKHGGLWLEIPEGRWFNSRFTANLQTLTNQAGIALERAVLLAESQHQAKTIEAAYIELQAAYDTTLAGLMSALDARDRETEGHSSRVGQIAQIMGRALSVSDAELKTLERGALLHDIGKIGISDTILHKPGPLTEDEWKTMRTHPEIGSKIVADIPFLEDTIPIIRHHQERWDGSGYPDGLQGFGIPFLARIFAVADAYDALTSTRPYRSSISPEEALLFIVEKSGILFDPSVVKVFEKLASEGKIPDLHLEKIK